MDLNENKEIGAIAEENNVVATASENKVEVSDNIVSVDRPRPVYRFLVVEYCYKDDSHYGEKHVLGAYPDYRSARIAAGSYITDNVKKMKRKYRLWDVKIQKDRVYFDIDSRRRY